MENRIDYEAQAELLKALAHPVRLQIIHGLLKMGCRNVRCMEHHIGISQSSISQHLQRLRSVGAVTAERCGNEVYYRVDSESLARLIAAMTGEEVQSYVL